ncbi:hypothetical protein Sme01_34890 [Sphaerisporangium melleum]|uniref:DUF2530 domain-containing protein n=1 Tax=Sphaerisporangium melleum TaxID=321316 RepID=A0A917R946_9ACTN|nr:DUF2530 domain-containing protein [Sphaerisporangium melleum]GGK96563.1 hypothetical protein GCM10007964_43540 [Sphaerisporangium melleum]GII71013.1 hypothetical protein Sme01_34890 [Sphaerisporangium melleum]
MNEPRPPDLAPLETKDAATILAGTGLWVVALVVLLIIQPGPEHQWWIWTCAAGVGLGIFGYWFVKRRDRPAARPAEASPPAGDRGDASVPDRTRS